MGIESSFSLREKARMRDFYIDVWLKKGLMKAAQYNRLIHFKHMESE